jgi:hypothetical protein
MVIPFQLMNVHMIGMEIVLLQAKEPVFDLERSR